jgi:hypothetical protein
VTPEGKQDSCCPSDSEAGEAKLQGVLLPRVYAFFHLEQCTQQAMAHSSVPGSVLSCQQLSKRLEALTEVAVTPEGQEEGCCPTDTETGESLLQQVRSVTLLYAGHYSD